MYTYILQSIGNILCVRSASKHAVVLRVEKFNGREGQCTANPITFACLSS